MGDFKRVNKYYEELKLKPLINAIAEEKKSEIRRDTKKKADEFTQRAANLYHMAGGMDPANAKISEAAAAGLQVKDAGKEYKRRKIFRGTKIMVQLIKNANDGSATALEFGSKNRPPTAALRRTLVAMGGYLKVRGEGSIY